ncbi:ribonuclease HI family protein [Phormidium sp. CCY1219]|jgi:ribonuclease HI|uniref:ribonuclease HI family protein n=1 Tax=Phormidium sp. CCY1219 TaxID=2886104 RepID=UPI002D1E5533|nr:ribonuclease HI family protein [Phormidium sp. CCY1219]MEB3827169.1 ribonuclease HI family protein [Phormidium sp. CCY1219]
MYVMVYSDGASRRNPGPAGAGAVLTDERGEVLYEVCQYLGQTTNNQAEYSAAILGLEKALEIGATKVLLKADSQLLIKQINGEYRVKNPDLKPLYEKVIFLLDRFDSYDPPQHIPRQQNHLADAQANRAIDEQAFA